MEKFLGFVEKGLCASTRATEQESFVETFYAQFLKILYLYACKFSHSISKDKTVFAGKDPFLAAAMYDWLTTCLSFSELEVGEYRRPCARCDPFIQVDHADQNDEDYITKLREKGCRDSADTKCDTDEAGSARLQTGGNQSCQNIEVRNNKQYTLCTKHISFRDKVQSLRKLLEPFNNCTCPQLLTFGNVCEAFVSISVSLFNALPSDLVSWKLCVRRQMLPMYKSVLSESNYDVIKKNINTWYSRCLDR